MKHHQKTRKKGSKFLNKKGVFGGVLQSVGNFFQGLMHIIPRPLIFLIFIFIIVLIAQLLTYIFNIFGIYCTSGDIPMTIGFNPLKTAELIGDIPQASDLGKEEVDPNALQHGVENCVWQPTGTYTLTYDDGTEENSSTPRWFYNGRGGCVDCTLVTVYVWRGIGTPEKWCINDAHTKPYNEKGTLAKWFCGAKYYGRCEPPLHYYWQATTGQYVCDDPTCTGITVGENWNNILEQNGATPLYADAYGEAKDISHEAFVSVQCKDVRPKLTLYGLDVFNFQYWLIIMLIAIMFWALKTFL